MAYVICFFTSDDEIEQSCALESSKLTNEELSEFKFVRDLKLLIGNDEHLPDPMPQGQVRVIQSI